MVDLIYVRGTTASRTFAGREHREADTLRTGERHSFYSGREGV